MPIPSLIASLLYGSAPEPENPDGKYSSRMSTNVARQELVYENPLDRYLYPRGAAHVEDPRYPGIDMDQLDRHTIIGENLYDHLDRKKFREAVTKPDAQWRSTVESVLPSGRRVIDPMVGSYGVIADALHRYLTASAKQTGR